MEQDFGSGSVNLNYIFHIIEANMERGNNSRGSGHSSKRGGYINGISDTCIENVLGGATLGVLGGNVVSVAIGAVAGSFTGGCWRSDGNGGGGGQGSNNSGSDCSGGSQCGW